MIDSRMMRENPQIVEDSLKRRMRSTASVQEFLKHDAEFRTVKGKVDNLRHHRNKVSEEINTLVKEGKSREVQEKIQEAKAIPQQLAILEEELHAKEAKLKTVLAGIPNILHADVPLGKEEGENAVLREIGGKPKLEFKARDHIEVGSLLDIIDIERAAKVAGARFYYLKNEAAMLDIALQKFALDNLYKKGFTVMYPPLMLKRQAYEGVTNLDVFEEMLYKIEKEDLYLIATSEHSMAAYYMDEVLDAKKMPIRLAGVSPCFRKEAGAHGKDTKGIFRVHNFNKVEQFVFCKPEDSEKEHALLLKNAEEIFKKLKLPYRVVELCSGQVGNVSARTYDLEVWMPAQGTYREAVSCSNCTDYQSRGLNIKYADKTGSKEYAHTLNSTAIATSRILVAILENYQQEDGSVAVPAALQKYVPFKKIEKK